MSNTVELPLDKVKVKPVTDAMEVWDVETALSRHHPLGAKKAQGCRMYYVASYRAEWIAVLVFDAAIQRNKMRERAIGWSDEQRQARLPHVANNSRFLIAPKYQGVTNLASKVLALVSERISADWHRRYGVPLLALETYVDPRHNDNEGTCYTAAGWEKLGLSTGYQAYGKERTHGKWYFVKKLHPQSFAALSAVIPHALLTGVKEVSGKSNNNYVLDAAQFNISALQEALKSVPDPRTKHGIRYQFVPLLSLCIAAAVSGYTQYRQISDWIGKLPSTDRAKFKLRGDTVPTETTIGKLMRAIDPVELQTALTTWLRDTYHKGKPVSIVVLDGKALRGTASETMKQVGFLNVFATELGIVIDQLPGSKGGGEKKLAQRFVKESADIEGTIVLADAIHTDSKLIGEIQKKRLLSVDRQGQ